MVEHFDIAKQKLKQTKNFFKQAINPLHARLSPRATADYHAWEHPFLSGKNIRRFRDYSEQVWQFALEYSSKQGQRPLRCAFVVNMAQNMYKWAKLANKYGKEATLFPFPMDQQALSCPEWEEFNGEFSDFTDGARFLREHPELQSQVPCRRAPLDVNDNRLPLAREEFLAGNKKPLLKMLSEAKGIRHESILEYTGFYTYYQWAQELSKFEVLYAASAPFAAYFSGRPYCVFSVGGDLIWDCGRADDWGRALLFSFNAGRFLLLTNPHTLGHCRRLGLTNGLYLPYPMDDSIYCPGFGRSRQTWEQKYGPGIYVLCTSRLDVAYKGYDQQLAKKLIQVAKDRPNIRFVFIHWGQDISVFRQGVAESGQAHQFIFLDPVGKKRLIDYYRSCDLVLDHFTYGYYGATGLEAASVGKPVLMKLRQEHYAPLYREDVAPMVNCFTPQDVQTQLLRLVDNAQLREEIGDRLRQWLVRTHGEEKTVPLMLALLRLAAENVQLPSDLVSPLLDDESEKEKAYHAACLI